MGEASWLWIPLEYKGDSARLQLGFMGSMKALGWYGTTLVLDVHLVAPSVLRARLSRVTQPGYENRGVTGWYQRMVT